MAEEITLSQQMKDTIGKLRRAINDIEEVEIDFSDEDLYWYILDAVDELEMGDYKKGLVVRDGDFYRQQKDEIGEVTGSEKTLYATKAHIIFKTGIKDKADRENFSLRKNNLSVDTTKQSADHEKTLETLEKRLARMLYRLAGKITGVRVE